MSSRAEQKEAARQERLSREAEAGARARRRRTGLLVAAGLAAVAVVIALVVVSQSGSGGGGGGGKPARSGAGATAAREVKGIPQQGDVLGAPSAKVTMFEYGDLQCPACQAYSEQVTPQVIDKYVRTGKVKLDFQNFLIIGPDSKPAAEAALAAGKQDKLWQFIQAFYLSQRTENSGYVTDSFLEGIAKQIPGLDVKRWNADRKDTTALDAELARVNRKANSYGFSSTPSFLIQPRGRTAQPFGGSTVPTYAQVSPALDRALKQSR